MSNVLTWLPARSIRQLIVDKEVSPVEVTEHFLGRIAEHNDTLRAFKCIDEKGAREQAKRAEKAVQDGEELGPLHGIPISVKEYIPVEGLPLRDPKGADRGNSKHDALGVARLRLAGAVIVGTNTAMGISEAVLNPYDSQFEARNPWDTRRITGWSSSGGGAAAAAALVPIAIGTDGGGSTRLPAAGAGVVGIHPTIGLVPQVLHEPSLPALTVSSGPLCRTVVDAAITLQAMAGPDGRDFTCVKNDPQDYLAQLEQGVEGMQFAWTSDFGFANMYALDESPPVIAAIRDAAEGLTTLGASLHPAPPICEDFWEDYCITNYLFQIAMDVPKPSEEQWEKALEGRQRAWSAFRDVLATYDLLLSPTTQLLPRSVEDWGAAWIRHGDRYPHGTFAPTVTCDTHVLNWIGFPAMSVPCGFVDGLPVGLQLIARPGGEATMLRVASAFQMAYPNTLARPPLYD